MARYFFHLRNGDSYADAEGMEFADLQACRVEAARMLSGILRDRASEFWDKQSLKLMVTDEKGLILFVLALSAVEAPAVSKERQKSGV
jgi:hypothetical protein